MDVSAQERRVTFAFWIRTGRWPSDPLVDAVEVKFNPYHDPRNGRFTFAPGGPRSLSRVIISHRRQGAGGAVRAANPAKQQRVASAPMPASGAKPVERAPISDALYRAGAGGAQFEPASSSRSPRRGRGSNSAAFQDPMTLEQAFPGLRNSPAGAIVAAGDVLFDFGGPARAATTALAQNWTNQLVDQIRALEPSFRYESLGFPQTLQGQINQINDLRWTRAAAFLRRNDELRPLEVETVRFIQDRADIAYADGLKLLQAGKLRVRLSANEALGNYVDRQVRKGLRGHYARYGIEAAGKGPVRVNRRESISDEGTFRQPDARVGRIAFDVTLTQKTLKTAQVRGFFDADFQPTHVIIVRPRQVGDNYSYIIKRPEKR